LLRRQKLPNITLNDQSSISFVISSIGTRDEFIDKSVIPSILKQDIETFEIIITGHYQGRYLEKANIHYVPVRKFPIYFYKHFQMGVSECKYDWIVDMDDDMVLTESWYSDLIDGVKTATNADIYGFRMLNPEGSIYTDMGDVFGVRQAEDRIRPTSYFSSYIAKKAMFQALPYPTYMSGDRHHGLMISERGFKKKFLKSVRVIDYGVSGIEGNISRASPEKYNDIMELRKNLGLITKTTAADYKEKMIRWWKYAQKLERNPKKIGIWGWFGHGNVGDELILSSMIGALSYHEISVYTDRPEEVKSSHNIKRAFHNEELYQSLNELDLLLVGGGGVLHNRAITKSFPKELMQNCETPIIVYAAGIPFFDWCNDLYYFLSRCYIVTLRDNLCLSFIKQRFSDIPAQLLPDPAFMTSDLQRQKVPGKVVLNIRMIPNGWLQGLPENVNEILQKELASLYNYLLNKGYSPLVLGFESRDEEIMLNQGYNYKTVDYKAAIEEIATAQLLIGTRYHSGIIAITQRTPAILLNYQKKVEGLKTLVSTGIKVVDIENLNLIREFDTFSSSKSLYKYKLQEIEALKESIAEFNDMYVNYIY